jgi:hypothetical protein
MGVAAAIHNVISLAFTASRMELEDEVQNLRAELVATQAQIRVAVEDAHRQYRRDLVPFGNLPVRLDPFGRRI